MTDPALPGTPIDLPLPPAICETLGYPGSERYIGFCWSNCGDQLITDDGFFIAPGASTAFLLYKRHPAVALLLKGYHFGSSDEEARDMLVIDVMTYRASIAPVAEARAFLKAHRLQRPPQTEEQRDQQELAKLVTDLDDVRIDMDGMERAMKAQRRRVAWMMSWLDQCPDAEGKGRGNVTLDD